MVKTIEGTIDFFTTVNGAHHDDLFVKYELIKYSENSFTANIFFDTMLEKRNDIMCTPCHGVKKYLSENVEEYFKQDIQDQNNLDEKDLDIVVDWNGND